MAEKKRKRFEDRRRRRIARRQSEILAAAARVFAEKGYANATMREIADEVDIAEGTLYNYFSGKREVLMAITQETETPLVTAVLEVGGLGNREAIVKMIENGLDISEAQLPFTRTLFGEAWVDDHILKESVAVRVEQIHHLLEKYVAGCVAAGVFRSIDPALCAQLAMGMFGSLILPALRGVTPLPSPEERHDLAEAVADLILDGVRARDA